MQTKPTVIATIGQKGGGGKSTAAFSLACEYARRGARVLIGDADQQQTCLDWGARSSEVLGEDAPTVIGLHEGFHRPKAMPTEGYDFVFIDTPARLAKVSRAALTMADLAIAPVCPGPVEVWALAATLRLIEEAQNIRELHNAPPLHARILMNKMQNTLIDKQTRAAMTSECAPVLDTELSLLVGFKKCVAEGQGPTTFDPRDKSALQTIALADEILEVFNGKAQAIGA